MYKTPILIILLLSLLVSVASAGSVHVTDPLDAYSYQVYQVDGTDVTYIGTYTVNDTLVLDSGLNYQIVATPNTVSLLTHPQSGVELIVHYIPLVVVFGLAGLLLVVFGVIFFKIIKVEAGL